MKTHMYLLYSQANLIMCDTYLKGFMSKTELTNRIFKDLHPDQKQVAIKKMYGFMRYTRRFRRNPKYAKMMSEKLMLTALTGDPSLSWKNNKDLALTFQCVVQIPFCEYNITVNSDK